MAFTENVLAYTKRIEKLLADLGGSGIGMIEKAKSLPNLPRPLLADLHKIARVRNRLVHDHDYRFADNEETFLRLCERVVAKLSSLFPRTESAPQTYAPDHQAFGPFAPSSPSPPPPVEDAFKREYCFREYSAEESSPKANASEGSSGSNTTKPPNLKGSSTGSTNNQDAVSSNITAWVLSAAAGFASWKILPRFCVRTVETGFWPFNSTHQEIVWGLVLPLSFAIAVGTYFLVRHSDSKNQ